MVVTVCDSLDLKPYSYTVNGRSIEVSGQYRVASPLTDTTSGIIFTAEDETVQDQVLIKKMERTFESVSHAKRVLRELRILRLLQHENVIDVRNIFMFGTKSGFQDLYIVSGLMEIDLASLLKSNHPLEDAHRQFLLYQILRGMKYVHSAQVVHRDLKPQKCLINASCDLRICDFSRASVLFEQNKCISPVVQEYVCTRWYRAPEVLCSWAQFTKAVDVWSIGCIFAEILSHKPLFAGYPTQQHIKLIIDLLGTPSQQELNKLPTEKFRNFVRSLPPRQGIPFDQHFKNQRQDALDMLQSLVKFDPDKRITVVEALAFPYLSLLSCPEDEASRPPLDITDFEYERRKVSMAGLREEIWREALQYHPSKFKDYEWEQLKLDPESRRDITKFRLLQPGESPSDEEH